ncbi:MAG: L,D-transpeptidase scaffold domain-containing protein, partial [Allosphingosinicella sp.]
MPKNLRLSALALLLATPTMPGAIQAAAFAQSEPRLGYQNQVPPAATTVPAATPVAPAPQPVVWRPRAAEELLRYVEEIGKEGLDPASYQPERLREALASGDQAALNAVANATFLRLSADLSGGYVRGDGRVDWHMPDSAIDGNRQQLMLA